MPRRLQPQRPQPPRSRRELVYVVQPHDIGTAGAFRVRGRPFVAKAVLGNIMPQDVGKHVFLIDGVLQVENQEQLERRLIREVEQRLARERRK